MATDYSIYKARTGSRKSEALVSFLFGEKLQTVDVNSPEKAWGVFGKVTEILTVPANCPLTKIGPLLNTEADKRTQLK